MSAIDFMKKTASSHNQWVINKKKKHIINNGKNFSDIKIYTMTMIVVANWTINTDRLYEKLPITPFIIVPKKRGRKKPNQPADPNAWIPIGSIISVVRMNEYRGVRLKKNPSNKKGDVEKKKSHFRNSITIVIKVGKDKYINTKVSVNGKQQLTGARTLDNTINCVDYIWRYIKQLHTEEEPIYSLKNEESVPRCIIKIVMTNVNYSVGYKIDRQSLDTFMNENTEFRSIFEPSYRYSGVNIKLKSENYVDNRMTALYWTKDGKLLRTPGLYSKYLDLLSEKNRKKELAKERFHSWLVFQSGSVIQSGPNHAEMKKVQILFINILRKNKKILEEKFIEEYKPEVITLKYTPNIKGKYNYINKDKKTWTHNCTMTLMESSYQLSESCTSCGLKLHI